jgi:uncharacterized membrane protein (UPF0127 family)
MLLAGPALAQCDDSQIVIETGSGDQAFQVEIADTWWSRTRGLKGRESLPDDSGMLFVYGKAQMRTFWMKNTPLSLDMIFIDSQGNIVHIARNTVPNSTEPISSHKPAKAVLELKAGTPSSQTLRPGDQAVHATFGNCMR